MSLNDGGVNDASAHGETKHRRRGKDLENALLDAAWQEFRTVGFHDLTMDAVAQRAGTSRAVLYRRWPGKIEMVAAAARYATQKDRGPSPAPTGSLREDMLNMLRWANRSDVRSLIEVTQHLGAYLATEGLTFADIRTLFRQGKPATSRTPIEMAIARGEIDATRITPRLSTLAFDLFRHEVIINAQPLTEETIREIVDDIVLPLLTRKD